MHEVVDDLLKGEFSLFVGPMTGLSCLSGNGWEASERIDEQAIVITVHRSHGWLVIVVGQNQNKSKHKTIVA
jgi:hypothetical protein